MRRTSIIAAAIGFLLAAALGVSIGNANELRADLQRVRERLARTETSLAVTAGARQRAASDAAASAKAAALRRKRIDALVGRLDTAELTLERRAALARALVPAGRSVFETRLLRGSVYDLLIVAWRDGVVSGIDVWRVQARPADPAVGARPSWELVYLVEPRPDFESWEDPGDVLIGPPWALRRVDVQDAVIMAEVAAIGDATGDGLHDLAIVERNGGSGGCGTVRLLQNLGTTLRETFHRNGCIHSLEIEHGLLVYSNGFHNSCRLAERARCVARSTRLRWTGSSWVVIEVERDVY